MQSLSRGEADGAIHELGEILLWSGKIPEIAVYDGASIMLQFEVSFRTADVHAKVEAGDHGALMDAAKQVAERHGWLRSWLSEAVTVYLGEPGGTSLHRSCPDERGVGLRVTWPDRTICWR